MSLMSISPHTTVPPGATAVSARHELTGRREEDRGIELRGRVLIGATRPCASELARERLSALVAGA